MNRRQFLKSGVALAVSATIPALPGWKQDFTATNTRFTADMLWSGSPPVRGVWIGSAPSAAMLAERLDALNAAFENLDDATMNALVAFDRLTERKVFIDEA